VNIIRFGEGANHDDFQAFFLVFLLRQVGIKEHLTNSRSGRCIHTPGIQAVGFAGFLFGFFGKLRVQQGVHLFFRHAHDGFVAGD